MLGCLDSLRGKGPSQLSQMATFQADPSAPRRLRVGEEMPRCFQVMGGGDPVCSLDGLFLMEHPIDR